MLVNDYCGKEYEFIDSCASDLLVHLCNLMCVDKNAQELSFEKEKFIKKCYEKYKDNDFCYVDLDCFRSALDDLYCSKVTNLYCSLA